MLFLLKCVNGLKGYKIYTIFKLYICSKGIKLDNALNSNESIVKQYMIDIIALIGHFFF